MTSEIQFKSLKKKLLFFWEGQPERRDSFYYVRLLKVLSVFTDDLSKLEDKELELKKEGDEGKGAKKAVDPEVNSAISIFNFLQLLLFSVKSLFKHLHCS